jgi:hypothetical protein
MPAYVAGAAAGARLASLPSTYSPKISFGPVT